MALRFMDGFDHCATADIGKKWTAAGGATISAGNGRRATACLRHPGGTDTMLTLDNQPTWILGWAGRWGQTNAFIPVITLTDGGAKQIDLVFSSDSKLYIRRGGSTILGSSSVAFAPNVYYYVEWKVTIANSILANTCVLRANGTECLTLAAGTDTQATANASANGLSLAGHGSVLDYDDLYLCDGTGGAPYNDFLGDCRVDTLLPNAEGSTQQWTPSTPGTHYTLVDETAPTTTDYVSSVTPTHRELFGMQDLTVQTGTIYGVQLGLAVQKSDAGARSIKGVIRSGASEMGSADTALSTGQLYLLQVQAIDPATGGLWNEGAVNNLQVGAEVV
jgi:hypothetical protein